ncbi:28S ribosomal protein S22, mitochondrial-like [Crassostrea angulata]|uniref:28S ribosomal protein S22, mitochondrial-like n=1 Tax=Magallana angulata TaxID=2784310 RepID=UPI0022B09B12|nr:28S ribosomal protein S22, mitochondrial-like [Crassostrea angulata]
MSCNLSKAAFLQTFRKLSCVHSQLLLLRGVHVSQFKPPVVPTDIDPFPLFMEEGVQTILNDITGIDLKKTALLQPKKLPLKPVLRAVPDKELKRLQADSFKKERSKIEQRPPFMRARKEISRELARNPEIAPVMTNNLLFIDTSAFTRSERANKDKVVVVRDTEGTLRTATQEERDRAIQIAFPVRGRTIFPSSFFKPENLHNALQRCRHSYVLDKVCVQYDPDHPEFLRITKEIYDYILERREFDALRGTRHFGSMAFYLSLCHREYELVLDMLERKLIVDVMDYIRLHRKIHSQEGSKGSLSRPLGYDKKNFEKLMGLYMKRITGNRKKQAEKMVESLLEAGLPEIIKENLSQRELIDSYLKLETNVY